MLMGRVFVFISVLISTIAAEELKGQDDVPTGEEALGAGEIDNSTGNIEISLLSQAESSLWQLQNGLKCENQNEECEEWAKEGECAKNPGYMSQNCKKACSLCEQMEIRTANGLMEIGLMGLRSLHIFLTRFDEGDKALHSLLEDIDGKLEKVAEGIKSIVSAMSAGLPNPVKFLRRVGEFLQQQIEALPTTLEDRGAALTKISVESSSLDVAKVVPSGSLNEALFGMDNGVVMPLVGFGTWQLTGDECYQSVLAALKAGYRHIDTAQGYQNEREVGRAMKDSGLQRGEIFLSTKLSNYEDYGEGRVFFALEQQLRQLDTTYVDLYMLHGPNPEQSLNLVAWKQMEVILRQGLARAIGLSNFGIEAVQELMKQGSVKPMYIQNKYSIYHNNGEYTAENELEFCGRHNIILMSYSTLNKWPHQIAPLQDALVAEIAKKHGKTSAQVQLRWGLQMGMGIIPRSSKESRIKENIDLFDFSLDAGDMLVLNSIGHLIESPLKRRPKGDKSVFSKYVLAGNDAPKADPFFVETEQKAPKDPMQVEATFINMMDVDAKLLWNAHDGSKMEVGNIKTGETSLSIQTFDSHVFDVQIQEKTVQVIKIDRTKGEAQKFEIREPASSETEDGSSNDKDEL